MWHIRLAAAAAEAAAGPTLSWSLGWRRHHSSGADGDEHGREGEREDLSPKKDSGELTSRTLEWMEPCIEKHSVVRTE